ncbi:MAG: ERMES complex subunit mmm1 [Ramalina farinacea]|uniref:Maintenance of mitochondrial morphology protein 1 n=1 Tax=Ramalina farinacea TaxID=258253 RepID=A0AA43TU67_9LECA|nr:ERMES complex subunit mmm1 [Ramalina farinacea]
MSSPICTTRTQTYLNSLSFTQGFLLGQLSIVILIGAFIKFFVFGEIPSPESTASARALARQQNQQQHVRSSSIFSASPSPKKPRTQRSSSRVLRPPPRLTTAAILSKTYYNVHSHQPESLDWFNVLIAQTIAQFRDDAHDDDAILTSLTTILNGPQKPGFLSDIKVTEINLGEEFPILSNCRVHPVAEAVPGSSGDNNEQQQQQQQPIGVGAAAAEGARLQARMDVDLSDFITLGIDTRIMLNYPRPGTAILPVALAVSVVRFSGTLSISFMPSSTTHPTSTTPPYTTTSATNPPQQSQQQQPSSTTPTTLAFSFLPDYRLDLSVRSLVGSRSRLQDIPKIAQLVESRLHQWIDERCVEPRVQQVVLPSFWPRKRNMRGPASSADGQGGQGDEGVKDGARGKTNCAVEEDEEGEGEGDTGDALWQEREAIRRPSSSRGGGEQDKRGFEEGLRMRRREYDMPGAMPGMIPN